MTVTLDTPGTPEAPQPAEAPTSSTRRAATFDGAHNGVATPASSSYTTPTAAQTINVWVNPTALTGTTSIVAGTFGYTNPPLNFYGMALGVTSTQVSAIVGEGSGGAATASANTALPLHSWSLIEHSCRPLTTWSSTVLIHLPLELRQ